jgi:hypothetical protein
MKEFLVIKIIILYGIIASLAIKNYNLTHPEEKVIEVKYKPSEFKSNYQIDLKQDAYLVMDQDGEVYYVPFDELENWFLEMNL